MKKSIVAMALLSVMPLGATDSTFSTTDPTLEHKGIWGAIQDNILAKDFPKFDKLVGKKGENITKEDFDVCIRTFSDYILNQSVVTKVVDRFEKLHGFFTEKKYAQTDQEKEVLSNFQNNLGIAYKKIADRSKGVDKESNHDKALGQF